MSEISLNVSFTVAKGGAFVTSARNASIVMNGTDVLSRTMAVTTSAVTLPMGEVATGGVSPTDLGLIVIKNLGATSVYIGAATVTVANAVVKINPNEMAVFRRNVALQCIGIAAGFIQYTTVES